MNTNADDAADREYEGYLEEQQAEKAEARLVEMENRITQLEMRFDPDCRTCGNSDQKARNLQKHQPNVSHHECCVCVVNCGRSFESRWKPKEPQ